MLFGQEYDKSLWLMMQSDNETQEILKKFLDNLTEEMYQCIYRLKEKTTFNPDEAKYSLLSGDGFNFLVEIDKGILTIALNNFYSNSRIQLGERYQLQLMLLKDNFLEYKDKMYLGSFSYKKSNLQNINDNGVILNTIKNDRYLLKETNFGYVVNSFPAYGRQLKSSKKVNISKMPEDVNMENLRIKKRKRCFGRKK